MYINKVIIKRNRLVRNSHKYLQYSLATMKYLPTVLCNHLDFQVNSTGVGLFLTYSLEKQRQFGKEVSYILVNPQKNRSKTVMQSAENAE